MSIRIPWDDLKGQLRRGSFVRFLIDLPLQAGWFWLVLEALAIPSLLFGFRQVWTTFRQKQWENLSADLFLCVGGGFFWAMIFAQPGWIYFQHWEGRLERQIEYRSGSKYRTPCLDWEVRGTDGAVQRRTLSGLLYRCPVQGDAVPGARIEKPSGSFRVRVLPF